MLLIDGVRYEEWVPKGAQAEDEFEREVKKHTQEIFGEQSLYFDTKHKLQSLSGIGSIPDGYVIIFGASPHWHIVEVELSSHPLHEHIVSQVSKFIDGIDNPSTQHRIARAMHDEIIRDRFLRLRIEQAIQSTEIYKFLSDLFSQPPTLTVIIEKSPDKVREILRKFANYQTKVVEFQTFIRERVGLEVHAHLFEPLYEPVEPPPPPPPLPVGSMEIKFWPAYRKYGYIGIWKKHREFFPDYDTTIELKTDDGDIFEAKVWKSSLGTKELWNLRDWYSKNPDLKEGDIILITPVEPMKKYRIQIRK